MSALGMSAVRDSERLIVLLHGSTLIGLLSAPQLGYLN